MPDEPEQEQNPDRADERESTYWPSDDASAEELVDSAFADAHLAHGLSIPEEEWAGVLGPIDARIDGLAERFVSLVDGAVDLNPSAGSVAESVSDVPTLARRLTSAVNRRSSAALQPMLLDLHDSAWDEYQLLLPLSDRISGPQLSALVRRAMDIWIATEQCARAIDDYHGPG